MMRGLGAGSRDARESVNVPLGNMIGARNCSIRGDLIVTGGRSDGANMSISALGASIRSVRKS